jgi:hypothetical protein
MFAGARRCACSTTSLGSERFRGVGGTIYQALLWAGSGAVAIVAGAVVVPALVRVTSGPAR